MIAAVEIIAGVAGAIAIFWGGTDGLRVLRADHPYHTNRRKP